MSIGLDLTIDVTATRIGVRVVEWSIPEPDDTRDVLVSLFADPHDDYDEVEDVRTERDQLAAEVERLTAKTAEYFAALATGGREIDILGSSLERMNRRVKELTSERDEQHKRADENEADARRLEAMLAEKSCDKAPLRVDNGDGSETWHGLPVTVPVGLIPESLRERVSGVRSIAFPFFSPSIDSDGDVCRPRGESPFGALLRIMLHPEPQPEPVTWACPGLQDGEWMWSPKDNAGYGRLHRGERGIHGSLLVDVLSIGHPPRDGRWQVANGVGTWIGP